MYMRLRVVIHCRSTQRIAPEQRNRHRFLSGLYINSVPIEGYGYVLEVRALLLHPLPTAPSLLSSKCRGVFFDLMSAAAASRTRTCCALLCF